MGRAAGAWTVAVVFLVGMIGTTLPTPLYPIYERHFGFGGLVVTLVFAAYAVGVLAALLLVGDLSDRVGRRPVLGAGVAFAVVSGAVFLIDAVPALFAGRVLSGISAGIFTGTATATIVDLAPARRASRSGLLAAAVNMLGLGLGPVTAGVLAQFAPWPLRLPYAVHLVLMLLLGAALLAVPEPVRRPAGRVRLRVQRLAVPAEVRGTFVPAAIAGFAGFAVLGLFTSVSPLFLTGVLGIEDHAVTGAVVFVLLGSSTIGQVASESLDRHRCLVGGCAVLAAGVLVVAAGIGTRSLWAFLLGAVVAGLGQGMSFRSGLTSVTSGAPADQRSGVSSAFFVVLYVALSLPVIGVGAAAQAFGIVPAGVVFAGIVAVLAVGAGLVLARRTS
ncbi:MFS transporter [Saccharopolyspora cebuensis]|uniref:MFS transporter n=1 Tax=Saccharopolyspora cebuensis TaxID=418759 RepID=A0ABV4CB06_9PSEU